MENRGFNTRLKIIEQAAVIFNKYGYAGSSLNELMKATGLKKGGIYNHFKSKDEIIIEAFDYSVKMINRAVYASYKDIADIPGKLLAIVEFYRKYPLSPVIEGGCPIVNTAVDSDNAHPALKERVKTVLNNAVEIITSLIEKGQQIGQVNENLSARDAAMFFVTTIQGAILMTRTIENSHLIDVMAGQLKQYINLQLKK